MEESNKRLIELLGSKINKIDFVRSEDFESINNQILADQVRICLENEVIIIKPLVDTDELEVQIEEYKEIDCEDLSNNSVEMYFNYSWLGINTKGYSDVFLIATSYLDPNILILSEGSALKIFTVNEYVEGASWPSEVKPSSS